MAARPIRVWLGLGMSLAALGLPAAAQQTEVPFGIIISEQAQASFDLVGAGARAAAMGGAFTALADDATAASFNPAGLAQLLVPEASVVVGRRQLADDFVGFVSTDQVPPLPLTDTSTRFDETGLNFLSLTVPARLGQRRWAFQVSSQQLVDFTYRADLDFFETDVGGAPLFELHQVNRQTGDIRLLSVSAALEATQRALLGVTVNRWDGRWSFSSFNAEAAVGGGATEFFNYAQTNALKGWNVDLGVLLRYPRVNVGIRYRLPFTAAYDVDAALETNLVTPLQPLRRTRTHLSWPRSLNVGVAFKPSDFWVVTVDWGRTDWSQTTFRLPGAEDDLNFFDLAPGNLTAASTANTWRVGTERLFLRGVTVIPVRAGVFREPQPAADPVTGDRLVSVGYSVGTGVKRGPLAVDLAVVYKTSSTLISRFLEPDEIESGVLRATSLGRRDRREVGFFVSAIVQVPKGSKISRWLHELFIGPLAEAAGESSRQF